MTSKWGIKHRVLLLALIPAITISILLGGYFIGIRLEDLSKALNDRGTAIASRLASQGEYGMFARDTESLRHIARNAINKEVSSVAFYDKKGGEIASAGKLTADIIPPRTRLDSITIIPNSLNDTVGFIAAVTLPDVVIDVYPEVVDENSDENIGTSIIGWVKVELDRKATRLKEYQVLAHCALIGLLGLSISCLLALRLGYEVTQPVLRITNAVERIKDGHLETRLEVKGSWELGILESGINTMASAIQEAREEMQQHIDRATADLRNTLQTIEVQNLELDTARKQAEAATEVKSEFLASMSHELRTPLNGMVGFINILNKTGLEDTQREYLSTIQKSATSLLNIINDILDFSKIEAGKLELDLMPTDIRECVEDTLTLLGPSAHEKGLELVPFIYSDVPSSIMADPLRIKQVVTNLVSNAIKFTEAGSVVIRVMLEQDQHQEATICISVTDTGIGIAPIQQKELFNAFNQANPNITRRFGGTGLGLVICKKLVTQMHGTIELESETGKGSTFWFTLRAQKLADNRAPAERVLHKVRILLFEKHKVASLALQHMLEQWGLQICSCDNADGLLELGRDAEAHGIPFDMVLLGVNQPCNELDFLTSMIAEVKNTLHCPVGVLVNSTEYQMYNHIIKAGATLCLAKPVCRHKLYTGLCKIILHDQHVLLDNDEPVLSSAKILAVDDNPANLKLVKVFLENIGVEPTVAKSGMEAIEYAHRREFDLILMDLHMPNLDGIETAVQIRSTKNKNANTPIVALSAHVMISDQERIIAAGMNDYLTKPIDENKLRASIYKWTHSGLRTNHKETMDMNEQQLTAIDWGLCLKLAGNQASLAREMLDSLVAALPSDLNTIMAAYQQQNLVALRAEVHRLHGACCYVGVPQLRSYAKELESAIVVNAAEQIKHYLDWLITAANTVIDHYHTHNFATQTLEQASLIG